MYRIRVDKQYFNFSCAHFLLFNDGTREPLHGHNYWAWVEVEGELGPAGYVLDYITFKPVFRKLCDGLDHKTIFPTQSGVLSIEKNRNGQDGIDLEFQKRFEQGRFEPLGQSVTEQLVDERVFVE